VTNRLLSRRRSPSWWPRRARRRGSFPLLCRPPAVLECPGLTQKSASAQKPRGCLSQCKQKPFAGDEEGDDAKGCRDHTDSEQSSLSHCFRLPSASYPTVPWPLCGPTTATIATTKGLTLRIHSPLSARPYDNREKGNRERKGNPPLALDASLSALRDFYQVVTSG